MPPASAVGHCALSPHNTHRSNNRRPTLVIQPCALLGSRAPSPIPTPRRALDLLRKNTCTRPTDKVAVAPSPTESPRVALRMLQTSTWCCTTDKAAVARSATATPRAAQSTLPSRTCDRSTDKAVAAPSATATPRAALLLLPTRTFDHDSTDTVAPEPSATVGYSVAQAQERPFVHAEQCAIQHVHARRGVLVLPF